MLSTFKRITPSPERDTPVRSSDGFDDELSRFVVVRSVTVLFFFLLSLNDGLNKQLSILSCSLTSRSPLDSAVRKSHSVIIDSVVSF